MTSAPDTGRTAEAMRAEEALALRDELMAYAAQLIRMSTQAGLCGRDLSVRVKEPEHLAHLITRAASAIQSRKWAAAEQEAATLRARLQEAERALKPFADVCDADHMRYVKDEQVLELSTRAEVPVSEKLRGRDFRAARLALQVPEGSDA